MFGFPRDTSDPAHRSPRVLGPVAQLEDRVVPTLFANPDLYSGQAGQVLTIPVTQGVLSNDFSDAQTGEVITATPTGPVVNGFGTTIPIFLNAAGGQLQDIYGNNLPVPNASRVVYLSPDGSFTVAMPSENAIPAGATALQFNYKASNLAGENATGTVTINFSRQATKYIVAGADATGGPHIRVFESGSGDLVYNFFPYEESFRGGVRAAVGDVNGDGVDDIATIPAAGGSARVRIFDGVDGAPLYDGFAFDPAFRGGGYVAFGDFNDNGTQDLIVGAGEGGGPRIQVIELNLTPGEPTFGTGPVQLADFFAYDPSAGSFGVRVAAGDLENVGRDFIITANGRGGNAEVRVFDGNQVLYRTADPYVNPHGKFYAYDGRNTDGVFISTGNFRGDGKEDIVTGSGAGSGIVRIFDGRNYGIQREFTVPVDETSTGGGTASGPTLFPLQNPPEGTLLSPALSPNALVQAIPGNTQFAAIAQGGARVAVTDYNQDGVDDVVVGSGPNNSPRIRIFDTTNQTEFINILAFSASFLGGVNVAAD